jgi:ribosomal protein S18 acetylase RimI-like enzyme
MTWILLGTREADIDALMNWFTSADAVTTWGGPKFRHPFTPQSFRRDCHWPDMASFSLWSPDREFTAFGQLYERNGHINLARLVVKPQRRGQGIGRTLIRELMNVGRELLPLDSYSLFVYRNNEAALRCYQSLGFEIQDYPPDQELADVCYFMTRPVPYPNRK